MTEQQKIYADLIENIKSMQNTCKENKLLLFVSIALPQENVIVAEALSCLGNVNTGDLNNYIAFTITEVIAAKDHCISVNIKRN